MLDRRIPTATYRIQFHHQFRFKDARGLVPYLLRLGISDLYASPIFKAQPGSTHGYDVTDPTSLNHELGTGADFDALAGDLREQGMGLLLDIVPNHMAASPANPWWRDVTEKGSHSPYKDFFDTDWLAFGQTGGKQPGHRRFFDIGDLIGLRVEDPRVFEATHSLVFRLVEKGQVTGLRIDHIDGLYDPLEYLSRLQGGIRSRLKPAEKGPDFYIVVEKILSGDEALPEEWPVSGTTGYDFAGMLNAFFVDSRGAQALDDIYARFTGSRLSFDDIVYEKKRQVIAELFPNEIRALGKRLAYLARQDSRTARLSPEALTGALAGITACLPVYRTYMRDMTVPPRDKTYLERAIKEAQRRNPNMDAVTLGFLKRVLTLDLPRSSTSGQKEAWLGFVLRWQQLTGAVMAKGFEDTALYGYNRLVSLNEVGGNPDSAGLSVADFHRRNTARLAGWPHTLNATSTHDTKRSEDVRARINVLSEIPEEWEQHLLRWQRWNQPQKRQVDGLPVPEPDTEVLLYQTLLGAWPLAPDEVPGFKERLQAYMVKAMREAKAQTSWLSPRPGYESAVTAFLESILESSPQNEFLHDFLRLEKKIAFHGALNSLAQVLLKITLPGVPDFYQGTELWDFSLVDPDNRRPVDFEKRREILEDLVRQETGGRPALVEQLLDSWEDGRLKLYVIWKALSARKSGRDAFQSGKYVPLEIEGRRQEHVCAFLRSQGETWFMVVVPRLTARLVGTGAMPVGREAWGHDQLLLPRGAPKRWLNIFTGEELRISGARRRAPIADILHKFPVTLMKST